jgi:4-hydroxy-3-methylbut-2-enyl diphosphate reductase IspH
MPKENPQHETQVALAAQNGDRQGVKVIFHGHAHHGSPMGYTSGKIPVYNVCQYVLSCHTQKPFCLYEI